MKKISYIILLAISTLIFVAPIVVTIIKSLQFDGIFPTLTQFSELLITNYTFLYYFWNSVLYSIVITIICIVISFPLGFLFAWIKFPGRDMLFFVFILVMLLPFQATLLPNYIQLRDFNMLNTPYALILPMTFSPFAVFLLRQSMKAIPSELLDYTLIETSSVLRMLWYVVIPQVKTMIIALSILIFCESWNMVEQALIFASDNMKIMPLSVILPIIPSEVIYSGAMIYMYPILILFFLFKESLQSSIESYHW